MKRVLTSGIVLIVGVLALWVLPIAVETYPIFVVLVAMFIAGLAAGYIRKAWLFAVLMGTYIGIIDLFWLAKMYPNFLWLLLLVVWVGGTWLVGHIGSQPSRIFHQALASFLVVEVCIVLSLWPLNILSKSVIAVSFGLFLWHEFIRDAPNRQRLQESVVPFLLIVTLMTLTGHWAMFK